MTTLSVEAVERHLRTRWLGRPLRVMTVTSSTNDEAASAARGGAPHGLVIVADSQTGGRGRAGHTWWSPPGENLYLSAVLRLPLPPSAAPPLTLAAGVAVCDLARAAGAAASLKWPNDVIVQDRKVAGILTEMSTRGARIEFVVVGIGLDVNGEAFPDELATIATSLRRETGGAELDRARLLAALLGELERRVDAFVADGAAPLVDEWKRRSSLLGRHVTVDVDGRQERGVATDVDAEGALWLEADDGRRLRVISGEVVSR